MKRTSSPGRRSQRPDRTPHISGRGGSWLHRDEDHVDRITGRIKGPDVGETDLGEHLAGSLAARRTRGSASVPPAAVGTVPWSLQRMLPKNGRHRRRDGELRQQTGDGGRFSEMEWIALINISRSLRRSSTGHASETRESSAAWLCSPRWFREHLRHEPSPGAASPACS